VTRPRYIGELAFTAPSGNSVDVAVEHLGGLRFNVNCCWERLPLPPADALFEAAVVEPAVARLLREFTEKPEARVLRINP
jgi:hypothetical protein